MFYPVCTIIGYTYVVTTMVLLMWWGAVVYQHHQYDDDSRHGVFCTVHGGYPYRCDDILSFNSGLDLCKKQYNIKDRR